MVEEGVQLAIGIDLGRTYSYVGIFQHRHQRVEILPNTQGNTSTPSYVAFTDIELLIGDAAMNQAFRNPANTIYDMERLIGRRFSDASVQEDMKLWPFKVIKGTNDVPIIVVSHAGKEKKFSAVEISSMLLKYLKGVVESYIYRTVEDAVITVPNYFDYFQRQAIKNAGQIAGLNVLQTISEPIAAATAYELHKRTNRSHETLVLIFDFGRTAFDVSLIILDENGKLEVKAVGGHDRRLGGQNIDTIMVNHFVKIFNKKYKTDIRCNLRALGRLRNFCVKAKEPLSSTTETTIEIDSLHQGIDFSKRITRAEFEDLNAYLFCKCIEYVKTCLRDARINKEDVDEIVLVGGSTRIPKVQQLLRQFFNGKDLRNQIHPSRVNAYGAAIIAEILSREKRQKFENLVFLDTVPLSLGVDAYDGTFSVIVPRNTPIPAKKERIYFTTRDDQRCIYFKVYMGERTKAEDNILLGKFNIAVPVAPRGKSNVKVVFNIDADGNLNCWVKELTASLKKKITIDNKKRWISKEEIEMMLKDAEKYKVEDKEYKKKVFARNALEEYIYNVKRKVKNIGSSNKTFLYKEHITKMENAIEDASQYLDQNELAHVDEYQNTLNQLEKLCVSIIRQLL